MTAKEGQSLYLYKDCHALVIGVSNYERWPKLPNAANDAKEVASKLKEVGFEVELVLDPTSHEMKKALNEMVYGIAREKDRALLLYYAGHGETETLADKTKMGYIIPRDCPVLKEDPLGFISHAISMREIESISLRIQSKHVLMLFDSCFSGSLFTLVRAIPDDITEKSTLPVRQYITAGREDEQVPDRSMFKRSFLIGLEGDADLTGDGYITGTELGMYLSDKVVNYTHRRQHPQYGKINNPNLDRGDFILIPRRRSEEGLKGQRTEMVHSSSGAKICEAGFPAIGTKYTYKITTEEKTFTRTFTVIEDGMFEDKSVHRIVVKGIGTNIYDKASKNWIGQIAEGKVKVLTTPHDDLYRFPLFVGKKHRSKYSFYKEGRSVNIDRSVEVTAFEKVTVPAGTFEAFEIQVKVKGVKRTFWYSPSLKIFVNRKDEHHRQGISTWELIEYKMP
ncbi:MAG: caspase domain-containing protein [Candidatus Hodarchaeota archaeon]